MQTPGGKTMLAVLRRMWPEWIVLRGNEAGELEEGEQINRAL